MQDQHDNGYQGPFISSDVRPQVNAALDQTPLMDPNLSRTELLQRAQAMLEDPQEVQPHETDSNLERTALRHPDVSWTEFDGETILLHLETGRYYTLNRVSSVIWELLSGENSLADILDALQDRFDVTRDTAKQDLLVLAHQLRQEELVVEPKR